MNRKNMLRHEQQVECLINCRYYKRCKTKCGKRCKHLGGQKIPSFKLKQAVAI